jgi:membrane-associated phospholipid phosphatase
MLSVLEWGIGVIAAIQTARTPLLDAFFKGMSDLGSEYFYFAALPFICTMVNRIVGIRIALAILTSVAVNSLIKNWVAEPRPFVLDPTVGVVAETGFGFPSGHAQQAALFWGLVVFYARKWWVACIGALLVGLIGLSRIYLGVHYPTDVLGSLLIAGVLLYGHQFLVKHGQKLWRPSSSYLIFAIVLGLAICACVFIPAKDMISGAGLCSGLIGGLLANPQIPPLSNSVKRRFVTASLTAVLLLLAYISLKLIFPKTGEANYEIFSFVRYFACGFILNAVPLLLDRWESR